MYRLLAVCFVLILLIQPLLAQNTGLNAPDPRSELEIRSIDSNATLIISPQNYLADTSTILLSNRQLTGGQFGTAFRIELANENGLSFNSESDLPQNNSNNTLFLTPGGRVGVGDSLPVQSLTVNGQIQVGADASAIPTAGTIRFNSATSDFEGYNGTEWISFTDVAPPPPPPTPTDTPVVRSVVNVQQTFTTVRNAIVFPPMDSIIIPESGMYLIGYYGSCLPAFSSGVPTDVAWSLSPYIVENGNVFGISGAGIDMGNFNDDNGSFLSFRFIKQTMSSSFVTYLAAGKVLKLGYRIANNNPTANSIALNSENLQGMYVIRLGDF